MIIIDAITYNVHIGFKTLERTFEIIEGQNSGTAISGKHISDIIGTGYTFTMNIEPNPAVPQDYDNLYELLTTPTGQHTISVPYGQSNLNFIVRVKSGTDIYNGILGSHKRWTGLKVTFEYITPQKVAE